MTIPFNAPRELVAWLEALTTPDSEDWTIIPDGKAIHGMAFREDPNPAGNRTVGIGLFKISRAELKEIIKSLPRAGCRPLGRIMVHLCADHAQNGTADLLDWLVRMAKQKEFSVVTIASRTLTAEAIAIQRQQFDHWVSAPEHVVG